MLDQMKEMMTNVDKVIESVTDSDLPSNVAALIKKIHSELLRLGFTRDEATQLVAAMCGRK